MELAARNAGRSGGGEDFNNWLLRAASVLAWGLVAVGTVLAVLALRRTRRRRN